MGFRGSAEWFACAYGGGLLRSDWDCGYRAVAGRGYRDASAAAIWVTWLYGPKRRAPIVAAVLVAAVLVETLDPFQFLTAAQPLGWILF
jgi:hypothetical protein